MPGGFVKQSGRNGQLQLAKVIARQFRDCVPERDRWRANVTPPDASSQQGKVYVHIMYYVGELSKAERKKMFDSGEGDRRSDRAYVHISIDRNFNIQFAIHGDFPVQYLDASIRNI